MGRHHPRTRRLLLAAGAAGLGLSAAAGELPPLNPVLVPRPVGVPAYTEPPPQRVGRGAEPPAREVVPAQAQEPPRPLPVPPAAPGALDAEPPLRLPALATPLGRTPKPSPEVRQQFDQFVDRIVDPQNTLDLVKDRDRLLVLKAAPRRYQLSDPAVANVVVVTPRQLSLVGKGTGTTVLTLWFPDPAAPDDPTREVILTYLVRVFPDPEARDRLEAVYDALAAEINKAFPDSVVKLQLVGDKVIVSGNAKDIADAAQILRVVAANTRGGGNNQRGAGVIPVGQVNVTVPPEAIAAGQDGTAEVGLQNFLLGNAGQNVVNMLRVGGEHQVMLRVCVAEVNRAAARSLGVNFSVSRSDGFVVFANTTGSVGLAGGGGGGGGGGLAGGGIGGGGGGGGGGGAANLFAQFGGGQVLAAVNALRTLNLARSLAEPNLVALNGRSASFQSGGQFPVPVTTGFTAGGLQGVQFVPFGVSLRFTPTVTDEDRVRLTVNADVSTRDLSVAQTNVGGASVPSLSTRNFNTTVEMRAGETLAVAGLIQNNFGSDATRVPFLGDAPFVGKLFGVDRTSTSEQELVILITPELVHPVGKGQCPPLPGGDLISPSDLEFYLLGRLQSYGPPLDPAVVARRRACERKLLSGPVGYETAK